MCINVGEATCSDWVINVITKEASSVLYTIFIIYCIILLYLSKMKRQDRHSGNTLTSHLLGLPFKAQTLCGKVGSPLPMVGSLQYRSLTNFMYKFPLPTKLPIIIDLYSVESEKKNIQNGGLSCRLK